ncbi:MAG: tRNA (cytosine(32)/uridine(32)-2'-O)-methyltransferase TrmJ [Moraxellaceae bacterium]|nr:MAG: tRNA (cytosine(32)/uridine(32)-2'-O)-methyltransferase TrmJ [Moraxellaceae bacterium]
MFQNIRIVMVNTSHPGNIGAAARAIKTMGFGRLYLVAPEEFPSNTATWRSAGAADVLEQAVVVEHFDDAIKDCQLVIGSSARNRRIPWPMVNPRECGKLVAQHAEVEQIAIVFGREDRGLTNEELQRCHYHVNIPANSDYGVLNIAAAIQVVVYELRMAILEWQNTDVEPGKRQPMMEVATVRWDEEVASAHELELFLEHLEQTLVDIEFHNRDNPRQLMTRLRRLYTRSRLDKMEVNILRGILTAVKAASKGAKKH